jgi:hypothetical protein
MNPMLNRRWMVALALLLPMWLGAQAVGDADRKRFEEIRARHDRGETISAEDQRFAQGIMARMNQANAAQRNVEYAKAHPPRESTGLVPLPDLGTGKYQDEPGGLYTGGRNTPPPVHLEAGLALAKSIVPLDADGNPLPGGRIVFLTIGMSNTTMESQAFLRLAAADPSVNPQLTLVDGAQGGQTAHITADPEAHFWTVVEELTAAAVTAAQVQAVWIKQANANPSKGFPAEAAALQADLTATLHNLHDKFANLKIAYLSSRIYGGYAETPLNPEPYAYEGGFAVKWVIAGQIARDADLSYSPSMGSRVRSPWLAWGPYLWADGTKGRRQDSLVYTREDVGVDGTHPSDSGRLKVGQLLLDFLKSDPTSKPWFLK